jgi:acyl carrier protein
MLPNTSFTHSVPRYDDALDQVRAIIGDALQLGNRSADLQADTPLIGNLPELDSMAVVTVISALEGEFDFIVDDDDDMSSAFQSVGSLVAYVEAKSR